jgi:hypothetical protein
VVFPALERQVAKLGLEQAVEVPRVRDRAGKVELYRSARVFVNPSKRKGGA